MAKRLEYKDEYFSVWTADFRSRLYTVGTALSVQGTELNKSLNNFRRGVPLGKNGFKHLCIHTAGSYGYDRVSLDDRVQWVLDRKDTILRICNDPYSEYDFWKTADKPYTFYACCLELKDVIEKSTRNQQNVIGHLPIPQDGACKGIQHYSAMLRDSEGAEVVNLRDS